MPSAMFANGHAHGNSVTRPKFFIDPSPPSRSPSSRPTSTSSPMFPQPRRARAEAEIDALLDIHRVLYRGRIESEAESTYDYGCGDSDEERGRDGEGVKANGGTAMDWETQGREVQRVVERWFEGDCIYDHPLARVSSRQSLLSHFILLHLLSTMYVPSITPSSIIHHLRETVSSLRSHILGDANPLPLSHNFGEKDRALATGGEEERLGLGRGLDLGPGLHDAADIRVKKGEEYWWKLYDVSADCKEMGAMECYDGYHLAMIEHVITLTFFPSLLPRTSSPTSPSRSPSSQSLPCLPTFAPLTSDPPPPRSSFTRRLAMVILGELSDVLRWDIPISTTVHFNEVGKATHIRDSIDIKDLIESFVPFAKKISWLTRRLSGAVTSTLGAIAMRAVQDRAVKAQMQMQRLSHAHEDAQGIQTFEEKLDWEKDGMGMTNRREGGRQLVLGATDAPPPSASAHLPPIPTLHTQSDLGPRSRSTSAARAVQLSPLSAPPTRRPGPPGPSGPLAPANGSTVKNTLGLRGVDIDRPPVSGTMTIPQSVSMPRADQWATATANTSAGSAAPDVDGAS